MRKPETKPASKVMAWKPRKKLQGRLSYDLRAWDQEAEQKGTLSKQVHAVAWAFLSEQLTSQQRQVLLGRNITALAFWFGLRGRNWGKELYPEVGETLNRGLAHLSEHAGDFGCGCMVRRKQAIVACALATDEESAQQIVARLHDLGDNEADRYLLVALTDETVPRKKQEEQQGEKAKEAPSPAAEMVDSGKAHQLFHDTIAKFKADAEASLACLQPYLRTLLVTNPPATYEGKRILVDQLNKLFHAADMALKHPERDEAVTLLALSGGVRSKKGYFQLRPTKGGDLLNLPDEEPQLIRFRRYRAASAGPNPPPK